MVRKNLRYIIWLLGILCVFLTLSTVLSYPWPVRDFNQEHPITATLGEYREDYRFHAGIDIGRGVGTPVYPVVSGIIERIVTTGDNAQVEVRGGSPPRLYRYIHIKPSSSLVKDQEVIAGVTLLGTVLQPSIDPQTGRPRFGPHLHFEEHLGEYNPLHPLRSVTDGGINPSPTQSNPPMVWPPEFRRHGTEGSNAVYYTKRVNNRILLYNTVDIITRAKDRFDGVNGGSANVGLYRMDYRIVDESRGREFGPFQSFRFDSFQRTCSKPHSFHRYIQRQY